MPTRPHHAAGPRMDTPVSAPSPPRQTPAATEAAVPLDEPPGQRFTSHGLCASPKYLLRPATPAANSFMLVLARMIAPARRSRLTTCASVCGTRSLKNSEPTVV